MIGFPVALPDTEDMGRLKCSPPPFEGDIIIVASERRRFAPKYPIERSAPPSVWASLGHPLRSFQLLSLPLSVSASRATHRSLANASRRASWGDQIMIMNS